ncbi:Uu.00g108710.m01.CDS01 [Anthostomella pinea]|uniref:Uu.00g108710.m01.CDS01 n=1 Tax=Anthostomella pinea TaxID=933095 RepID=A0AAI8YG34_9PEZI|nr:Uu.00g108710.m01.CDS01 [Anthostomella pinea]
MDESGIARPTGETAPTVFHIFNRLPPELRLKIWAYHFQRGPPIHRVASYGNFWDNYLWFGDHVIHNILTFETVDFIGNDNDIGSGIYNSGPVNEVAVNITAESRTAAEEARLSGTVAEPIMVDIAHRMWDGVIQEGWRLHPWAMPSVMRKIQPMREAQDRHPQRVNWEQDLLLLDGRPAIASLDLMGAHAWSSKIRRLAIWVDPLSSLFNELKIGNGLWEAAALHSLEELTMVMDASQDLSLVKLAAEPDAYGLRELPPATLALVPHSYMPLCMRCTMDVIKGLMKQASWNWKQCRFRIAILSQTFIDA